MIARLTKSAVLATLVVLTGCVWNIANHSIPAVLVDDVPVAGQSTLRLDDDISVALRSGLRIQTLRRGSQWEHIGSITEGQVYRPLDTALTVMHASQAHEAYVVVDDGCLVGVFLPAVQAFIATSKPITIPVQEY
jgi:hypothetical protein